MSTAKCFFLSDAQNGLLTQPLYHGGTFEFLGLREPPEKTIIFTSHGSLDTPQWWGGQRDMGPLTLVVSE